MKWFLICEMEWYRWDFGFGFAWFGKGDFEVRLLLGPWAVYAGRERPEPPFNPEEWGTVEVPVPSHWKSA